MSEVSSIDKVERSSSERRHVGVAIKYEARRKLKNTTQSSVARVLHTPMVIDILLLLWDPLLRRLMVWCSDQS